MKLLLVFSTFFAYGCICATLKDGAPTNGPQKIVLQNMMDLGDLHEVPSPKQKRCPRLGMANPFGLQLSKRELPTAEPVVGMASRMVAPKPQLYTIATVSPGKHLDLICRLLGIKDKEHIEKIILLAQTSSGKPLITQPQDAILNTENALTDVLNKALDEAEERKRKLSPKEIDGVVENVLDNMRNDQEDVPQVASRQGPIDETPEDVKPVSLFDKLKEQFNARKAIKPIIVQPKETLDDDQVGATAESSKLPDDLTIKDPKHALDVLENLKKQVSTAKGNDDLDRVKGVLERIQTMVDELEDGNSPPSDVTKNKIKKLEETLKDDEPTIGSRMNAPPPEQIKFPNPARVESNIAEVKKLPQLLLDHAQKAMDALEPNKLGQASAVPAKLFNLPMDEEAQMAEQPVALAPRVGEEPPKQPDLLESIRNRLKNPEHPMATINLPKKSDKQNLAMPKLPPMETPAEIMEKLKMAHDKTLAQQADLLKQHEENRQNILESIRNKFFKDAKPDEPTKEEVTPNLGARGQFDEQNTLQSMQMEDEEKGDKGKLGKLVGYDPDNHNGSSIYFLGDGVRLPMKIVPEADGSMQLSVDLDKVCSCKNSTCPRKRDIAAVVGTILEKEAELKSDLATMGHHGITAKFARSTDKLLKDLEDAGFDVHQEIVVLPQENVTVPIIEELRPEHVQEETNNLEGIHEFMKPLQLNATMDQEKNLLQLLLEPESGSTTTEHPEHSLVNRDLQDFTVYDPYNEKYDDALFVKPFKNLTDAIELEDALEEKLETLSETVKDTKGKPEKLVQEEAKKIFRAKKDEVVKEEVDLANTILSFMKNLATK